MNETAAKTTTNPYVVIFLCLLVIGAFIYLGATTSEQRRKQAEAAEIEATNR